MFNTNTQISRRSFLGGIGKAALVSGVAAAGLLEARGVAAANVPRAATPNNLPLVWVWKFSADGDLETIKRTLHDNSLGMILKTHDGSEWMTRFDHSPDAVVGPQQVENLANVFEQAGVPFHAWFVAQGLDPIAEARMCSDVLNAGARSIYVDLEPEQNGNYWRGPWDNANRFGEELRRLQPNAWVVTAPDARPWQGPAVPLAEFASFSNAIAPQAYWATFKGPANERHFAENGYTIGPDGVSPELMAEVCARTFQPFNLPIQPIGQGASDGGMWQRFVGSLDARGMQPVSLWRFGTADPSAYPVLRDAASRAIDAAALAAAPPPAPAPVALAAAAPPPAAPQDQPPPAASPTAPPSTEGLAYNQPSPASGAPDGAPSTIATSQASELVPNAKPDTSSASSTRGRSLNQDLDLSRFKPLLQQSKKQVAPAPQPSRLSTILSDLIGR